MDSGLAGLVAAETVLSHSDGARGILWVRGHTLPELVAGFGYEGAVGLLWEGFAGNGLDRRAVRARLGAAREAAFARLGEWLDRAQGRPPVEGVRLALASLPDASHTAARRGRPSTCSTRPQRAGMSRTGPKRSSPPERG